MVRNWRREQHEEKLQGDYEAGLGPAQVAEKKGRGESMMRKVLLRWQHLEQAAALSAWQRNLADSDIINMHHQMQWEAATRIMIGTVSLLTPTPHYSALYRTVLTRASLGWLKRNQWRQVQLVVRMWGRQHLTSPPDLLALLSSLSPPCSSRTQFLIGAAG